MCLLLLLGTLVGCASTRKADKQAEAVLSDMEQRRYTYYFMEAVRLEQDEEYDAAFEMYQHCLNICPDAASALHKIANYYFTLNRKDMALAAMQKAVRLEPDNYWYKQLLANYYMENNGVNEAIEVYESMLQQFPKRNVEILTVLVNLYNHTLNYDKVIATLNRLEKLQGKSEMLSMEKSRISLLKGDNEAAFAEMEALADEYPDNPYYKVMLGNVYMENQRHDEAAALFKQVLMEEPDNGMARIALAQYYKETQQDSAYQVMVDSVLVSANVDEEVKMKLMVQMVLDKADSTEVMKRFDLLMKQPQKNNRFTQLYVQYLLSKNQPEERVRPVLLRMLEIEPDNTQARLQLIYYASEKDDMPEIIRQCTAANDYTPEELDFYYYRGIALYRMGQVQEALEVYKQAQKQITIDSNTEFVSNLFSSMGDLYHALGDRKEVYACYDSALVYNPGNVLALNNYAYYLSLEDRELERAEQMSARTIEAEPKNATYLDTYAWVLYKLGRCEEAMKYIEEAIVAEPEPSDVLYEHAGDICNCSGNRKKAKAYWLQAMEIQKREKRVDVKLKKKIDRSGR